MVVERRVELEKKRRTRKRGSNCIVGRREERMERGYVFTASAGDRRGRLGFFLKMDSA